MTTRFLQAYLVAYLYWLLISLGCLGIAFVHALTGGQWGRVIERAVYAALRPLPAMALLFLPIALGVPQLYPWAPSPHRLLYLNVPFFLVRAAAYFAVWVWLALAMIRGSEAQRARIGGWGLLAWSFALTFASIDWVLSTEPRAHSTVFGLILIAGAGLSAYAAATLAACWPLRGVDLGEEERLVLNDLGNLLLAFVMLWAYAEFSQWLIVWSGNLPDEIAWYLTRANGGWRAPGELVIAFGFAAPFIALLFRPIKRRAAWLAALSLAILAVRWLDLYWTVMPSFFPKAPQPDWLDLLAFASVGAVWAAFFARGLSRGSGRGAKPDASTPAI